MLGLAYQSGAVPLSADAIERAIELNGVDIAMNKAAFAWGRRSALEPDRVAAIAEEQSGRAGPPIAETVDEVVSRRVAFLTAYQNSAYADRYARMVARFADVEAAIAPTSAAELTEAVARNLFKLMAIKDEYEVARLFTDGSFERQLRSEFGGWNRLEFHLAPPILARRDAAGRLKKSSYGPWMMRVFRLLARAKGLRGTAFDPFGHSAERRMERKLLAEYEECLDLVVANLTAQNRPLAIALAQYPEKIRGFGHVKEEAVRRVAAEAQIRREAFLGGKTRVAEAAE